jgi:hypothetical protein
MGGRRISGSPACLNSGSIGWRKGRQRRERGLETLQFGSIVSMSIRYACALSLCSVSPAGDGAKTVGEGDDRGAGDEANRSGPEPMTHEPQAAAASNRNAHRAMRPKTTALMTPSISVSRL